jgi:hypothetical protein
VTGTPCKGQRVVDEGKAGPQHARAVVRVEWIHFGKSSPVCIPCNSSSAAHV